MVERIESGVVVVGAGNAAMCAALAALENGAMVTVLERAPVDQRGGNSSFTAGAIRLAYNGADDLRRIMPDLTDEECARTDFGSYTQEQFYDDLTRVTEYHTDPELADTLVSRSYPTVAWMHGKGLNSHRSGGARLSAWTVGSSFGVASPWRYWAAVLAW